MGKIFLFIITLICLTSCKKDYDVTITGVDFHPNKIYENCSVETEFLDSVLIFGADFSTNPDHATSFYRGVGEVSFLNPVSEDKFIITSNQELIIPNDTLKTGENLINIFEFKILKELFHLSYNFRSTKTFLNKTGYYKFYFTAVLSDNTEVSDSCIVKINF